MWTIALSIWLAFLLRDFLKGLNETPQQTLARKQRSAQLASEVTHDFVRTLGALAIVLGVLAFIWILWYPILGH